MSSTVYITPFALAGGTTIYTTAFGTLMGSTTVYTVPSNNYALVAPLASVMVTKFEPTISIQDYAKYNVTLQLIADSGTGSVNAIFLSFNL